MAAAVFFLLNFNLIEDLIYFPIVIPYLLEHVVTYFNIYTKLEVIV